MKVLFIVTNCLKKCCNKVIGFFSILKRKHTKMPPKKQEEIVKHKKSVPRSVIEDATSQSTENIDDYESSKASTRGRKIITEEERKSVRELDNWNGRS